ncbi:MAG: hypothetical protein KC426_00515 [Oceanospirillaceae bacterium]|nr:hypothetical protein [Oceanospirillaceae bacterium]
MHSRLTLVQKTVLLLIATFVIAGSFIGLITYQHLSQVAGQQNTFLGEKMGQQLASLSAPLIVKQDYISLNVTLAELRQQGALMGAAVYDADGTMLAKAGLLNDADYLTLPIELNEQLIGSLHLRYATLDLHPSLNQLTKLLWPTLGLSLLACIVLGWWFGARLVQPLHQLHEAQEQLLEYGKAPPLDDSRLDEWGIINLGFNSINEERLLHTQTDHQYELEMPAGKGVVIAHPYNDNQPELEAPNQQEAFNEELHSLARELSSEPELGELGDPLFAPKLQPNAAQDTATYSENHLPIFSMDDLRNSENSTPLRPTPMPVDAFEPMTDGIAEPLSPDADTLAPACDSEQLQTSESDEPLVSLIYINVNTRDQGPIAAAEKHLLLKSYHRLVDQVCSIYGGAIETKENHDVLVTFDKPHEHMTHCVNALCAAQFFFGLYKAFNAQRATQNKAGLNIQIVVHTGVLEALDELTQEASQLSRRERQDHMVISQNVAYHPELQQRVLQADNCIALASGAVCLARLSSDYQDLLDMQISHFSTTI